jgi:hypothetical protein
MPLESGRRPNQEGRLPANSCLIGIVCLLTPQRSVQVTVQVN